MKWQPVEMARMKTTNAWIFAGVENVIGVQYSNPLCGSINKFDLLASWDYYSVTNGCMHVCWCVWMRHFIPNGRVMCMRVSIADWHYFHSKVSTQFVTIDHLMWLRIHFRLFIIHPFPSPHAPSFCLKDQIYIDFDMLQHDVLWLKWVDNPKTIWNRKVNSMRKWYGELCVQKHVHGSCVHIF